MKRRTRRTVKRREHKRIFPKHLTKAPGFGKYIVGGNFGKCSVEGKKPSYVLTAGSVRVRKMPDGKIRVEGFDKLTIKE